MADFIWPAYKNDKERIKYLSRKYKNASIYDAFVSEYKFNSSLSEQSRVNVERIPSEPRVGDVLKLTITGIDKNRIIFDTFNMKKEVSSKVNLYKYNFFKQFVPQTPVPCMVVDVDKNKISVDPIIPLMDNWSKPTIICARVTAYSLVFSPSSMTHETDTDGGKTLILFMMVAVL